MEVKSEEGEFGVLEFVGRGVGLGTKRLGKAALVVGRDEGAGIVIPDAYAAVSRKHAELVLDKGRWFVRDLGSSNGTFVDGKKVGRELVGVNARTEVRLGEGAGVSFRVKLTGKRGRPKKRQEGEKRRQVWRAGVHTITERDLSVLEWVAEHRFSTAELLIKACYSKPDPKRLKGKAPSGTYGSVRIAKLVHDGFLTASTYRIGKTVPLLLSQKGYNLLHGIGRVEWAQFIPEIGMATFEHECWIQRLRILFEDKHGTTNWNSERLLKQFRRDKSLPYVPDARFNTGGHAWVLELERTQKNSGRIKELLEIREKANKKTRMVYVMPQALIETFREVISKNFMTFPQGLYLVPMEDLETAYCNRSMWKPMPLADLLSGKPEPKLIADAPDKSQVKAQAVNEEQQEAKLPNVLSYYETIRKYFEEATAMHAHVREALLHNQGKLKGMWKPKEVIRLDYPNFPPSIKEFDPLMHNLEGFKTRSEADKNHEALLKKLRPFASEFSAWVNGLRSCQNSGQPWPIPDEKLESAADVQALLTWMAEKIAERKSAA